MHLIDREYDEDVSKLVDFKPALIVTINGCEYALDIYETDLVSPNVLQIYEWDDSCQPSRSWYLTGDEDELANFYVMLSKLKDVCAMYGGCI